MRRFLPQMTSQQTNQLVLAALIILAGVYVLSPFFAPIGWAVVLAIATWPLYTRFQLWMPPKARRNIAPLLFTFAITMIFIVPVLWGVLEMGRELNQLVIWLRDSDHGGVVVPDYLEKIPLIGLSFAEWWRANMISEGGISSRFAHVDTAALARYAQRTAVFIVRSGTFFVVTVLTLFFLFRDGERFGRRLQVLMRRLLGRKGLELCHLMVVAVRGTSDGVVLVGIGVGTLLGLGYALTGVPHAGLLGSLTALFAMIPFGAPAALALACLFLLAQGAVPLAIGLLVFGTIVIFVADHFLRPVLIGGNASLPFLWVFLGIFGGLATFSILGLFLGPALMVALVSLWREWTQPRPFHASLRRARKRLEKDIRP
jgi:predicted PurR-regulated permease PerM